MMHMERLEINGEIESDQSDKMHGMRIGTGAGVCAHMCVCAHAHSRKAERSNSMVHTRGNALKQSYH